MCNNTQYFISDWTHKLFIYFTLKFSYLVRPKFKKISVSFEMVHIGQPTSTLTRKNKIYSKNNKLKEKKKKKCNIL